MKEAATAVMGPNTFQHPGFVCTHFKWHWVEQSGGQYKVKTLLPVSCNSLGLWVKKTKKAIIMVGIILTKEIFVDVSIISFHWKLMLL